MGGLLAEVLHVWCLLESGLHEGIIPIARGVITPLQEASSPHCKRRQSPLQEVSSPLQEVLSPLQEVPIPTARGVIPTTRGVTSIARGVIPIARVVISVAGGVDPIARGVISIARGFDPIARVLLGCGALPRLQIPALQPFRNTGGLDKSNRIGNLLQQQGHLQKESW